MGDLKSSETDKKDGLNRVYLIVSIVGAIVAIASFVIDRPVLGYVVAAVLLLSAVFVTTRRLASSSPIRSAALATFLTILAFFVGWSISDTSSVIGRLTWGVPPFRVEDVGFTTFPFDGSRNPDVGFGLGYLAVTGNYEDGQAATSYKFDYSIPDETGAYAGFTLRFTEPQDLSEYNFLKFEVLFSEEAARIRVFLEDDTDALEGVILGDGQIVTARKHSQLVRLNLRDFFPSVTRSSIREIVFDANHFFVQGTYSVTIREIGFGK